MASHWLAQISMTRIFLHDTLSLIPQNLIVIMATRVLQKLLIGGAETVVRAVNKQGVHDQSLWRWVLDKNAVESRPNAIRLHTQLVTGLDAYTSSHRNR